MAAKKSSNHKPPSKPVKKISSRKTRGVAGSAGQGTQPDLKPIDRSSLLRQVHAAIPLPFREEDCGDGSHVYVAGDPDEVVVRVSSSRITVSVFAIAFEGSQSPVVHPQPLICLHWKRLPAATVTSILPEMIEAAIQLRRARFRKCESCGETKPPEWMHKTGVCQSCDQQHLGSKH